MIARVANPALRLALLVLIYPIAFVAMLALLIVATLVLAFDDAQLILEDLIGMRQDAGKIAVRAIEDIRNSWIGEANPRVGRDRSQAEAGGDGR